MKIGARNQLIGEITEIKRGAVMGEVKLTIPAGSAMASVMTLESIDDLGKYYNFRLAPESDIKGTHLLLLVPRKKRLREHVAEMKIWVDATTFLPRQLEYVEADGDSTLLAFQDIRVNVEVAADRFRIVLPKDVVVSETFNGFSLGQQSF